MLYAFAQARLIYFYERRIYFYELLKVKFNKDNRINSVIYHMYGLNDYHP